MGTVEIRQEYIQEILKVLTPKSCKILLALLSTADNKGLADTSLNILVEQSGMSKNSVRGAIKELEEQDLLTITHDVGIKTYYNIKLSSNISLK